ncbi:MAG: hypothetical protein PHR52_04710 [Fermentimonas sp.]|nr:hypothetical protein [Fermentimonas sp.]
MKRKLFTSLLAGILFFSTVFIMTSCSDSSDDFVETSWNIENFSVTASQWSWNSNLNRWEAVRQLEYIDEFIYENGAVIGFVFLGTQDVDEVQVPLPYIKSFLEDDGQGGVIDFTETISFEYSRLTNRVTFCIEPSDGFQDQNARQNYNFRIVMIW